MTAHHRVESMPAITWNTQVDGHIHAFAFFGRVPVSVLYDNDKCLVARILPDGTRIEGAAALKAAVIIVVLHYATQDPLT